MKLNKILYGLIVVLLAFASCQDDNYPSPDAAISGSLISDVTGKPIEAEEPNGFRMRLIAEDYKDATPIDFSGKADGTYMNTKVFSGRYKVVPIEGAFFPVDTQEVNISGSVEVNFKVTPFLAISASATAGSGEITVKYTITRNRVGDKIINCRSLVAAYPAVSGTIFDKAVTHGLSTMDDQTILATTFADTISGLEGGKTYYVRVAAATNNALHKYNYSPVMKINLP